MDASKVNTISKPKSNKQGSKAGNHATFAAAFGLAAFVIVLLGAIGTYVIFPLG